MTIYKPPKSDLHGNELKTFVQADVINKLFIDCDMVLEAATGFGKTKTGLDSLVAYSECYPDSQLPHLIIVPTTELKQQWESEIPALLLKNQIHVVVINGFVFNTIDIVKYGVVIVDEAHRVLNEGSEWFSQTLDKFEAEFTFPLSATLSPEHKAFLKTKIPTITFYQITLLWCVKNGLVPDHVNINIPVQLTLQEKSDMIKCQEIYDKYARYFANYHIFNPYIPITDPKFYNGEGEWNFDLQKGQVFGMLAKWKKATAERSHIYHNASGKLVLLKELLEKIENEKLQKCLVFGKGIDVIESIVKFNNNSTFYHSKCNVKQKKEAFFNFFTELKPFFATVNTIIEGFDMKTYAKSIGLTDVNTTCQLAVRLAYDSTPLKTTQTIGRILRYNPENPDQIVLMISFYVDDFIIRGKEFISQEKKWLISNLRGQVSIKWLDTIDEIEL